MAGINLLKQVGEREAEVEVQSSGGGLGGFASDFTVAEKIKLGLIIAGGVLYYFSTDYLNNTYLPQKLIEPQAQIAQIQSETGQVRNKLKELEDLKKFIEQHRADVEELKGRIRALN
ncbi:hypothetical protein GW916_02860, partial [bacterium]|nr:hypothetical protein [bacterium]